MADIAILAIPSCALETFIWNYASELAGKILVDATNSSKPGEDLFSMFAYSDKGLLWVKGLNDFGAIDVLLKKPEGKNKLPTKMSSPDTLALESVKAFAQESLGFEVKVVPVENFTAIARHQSSLGKEWMDATVVMLVLFILCQIYNILRYAHAYKWKRHPCVLQLVVSRSLKHVFCTSSAQPSCWKRLSMV